MSIRKCVKTDEFEMHGLGAAQDKFAPAPARIDGYYAFLWQEMRRIEEKYGFELMDAEALARGRAALLAAQDGVSEDEKRRRVLAALGLE